MKVDPIYIDDVWHDIWQWCITTNFRLSYRHLHYVGIENIPADGAVILSPNHCNALCDALAIVAMDRRKKVFAARADIFRNPRLARFLRFHRIMPIRRMRDGIDEVRRNDATIQEAVDVLHHDAFFCMMPEGTHRTMHSLLPLSKGIFRIAMEAARQSEKKVYIVPVGLEYGDYFHLWDSLEVRFGEPICVSDYLSAHPEQTEPQQVLSLRDILTERMRTLFLWVPDDENYLQNWQALAASKHLNRHSVWDIPLVILLTPLALICALFTIPQWLTAIIVRRKVKDPAFYNSIQMVVQLFVNVLSLGLLILPWRLLSEWLFRIRRLKRK